MSNNRSTQCFEGIHHEFGVAGNQAAAENSGAVREGRENEFPVGEGFGAGEGQRRIQNPWRLGSRPRIRGMIRSLHAFIRVVAVAL